MKKLSLIVFLLVWSMVFKVFAQGVEKLLPSETVLLITIPDWNKNKEVWEKHPQAQLFKDPSLQAAKEKFLARWRAEVVDPLEKELGIKFSDYYGIAKGQIAFALSLMKDEAKQPPIQAGFLLLIDSADNKEKLTKAFGGVVQKYIQSQHEVLTNRINEIDCYEFVINSEEVSKIIQKVFPDPSEGWESLEGPKPKPKNVQNRISACQIDSLLVIGNSTNLISKVIANKVGKSQTSLLDNQEFKKFYDSRPQESLLCAWANIESVLQIAVPKPQDEAQQKKQPQAGF
ncbi:MAG: hypothetical protein ACPMAG_08365, partial [Limisphaerales bacterium]